MSREKFYWDMTVGVSYVPTDSPQLQMLDILTHQDTNIRSSIANLRKMILTEVHRAFVEKDGSVNVNGRMIDSLLFTVTIKRGVQNVTEA